MVCLLSCDLLVAQLDVALVRIAELEKRLKAAGLDSS